MLELDDEGFELLGTLELDEEGFELDDEPDDELGTDELDELVETQQQGIPVMNTSLKKPLE